MKMDLQGKRNWFILNWFLLRKAEMPKKCHSELVSESIQIKIQRDPETSSG